MSERKIERKMKERVGREMKEREKKMRALRGRKRDRGFKSKAAWSHFEREFIWH